MNLRSKRPRPLTREEGFPRDARLFAIATEDTHAPKRYFRIFRNPRIKVEVLETEGGLSSPEHVLQRLDEFRGEYDLKEDDELWLMFDIDHWTEANHIPNFIEVCTQAVQKGFGLAHSNPCFEVWLLLHVADLDASQQFKRCQEVKNLLAGCDKGGFDVSRLTLAAVADAVARADKLDTSPGDRWPQKNGSHVYRIVKKLLPGHASA